jgi:hypothetical protein
MSCSSNSESESSETRELLIVYATETGNARDAADFIARQCRRIASQCRVIDIGSISLVGYSACTSRSFWRKTAWFTLRKYCPLRSFNDWFRCGAQGYDLSMEQLAAFRPPFWRPWGTTVLCFWTRWFWLWEVLLGRKKVVSKGGIPWRHRILWSGRSRRSTPIGVNSNSRSKEETFTQIIG